jgi:hypothetical protein
MKRSQGFREASQTVLTLLGMIFATAAIGWGQLTITATHQWDCCRQHWSFRPRCQGHIAEPRD